jgi:hypothetical protein
VAAAPLRCQVEADRAPGLVPIPKKLYKHKYALAAWYSGYRIRLQNRRSWVWIPPGCNVF